MLKLKSVVVVAGVLIVSLLASEVSKYILLKSSLKIGKEENGNYFMDAIVLDVTYKPIKYITVEGFAGVGFTAPREGKFTKQNHYVNQIYVKTKYSPFGGLGYFIEANFSSPISGNNYDVTHFSRRNSQAIGVELEFLNSL